MNRYPFDLLHVIVAICWLTLMVYWAISAVGAKQNVPGKGGFKSWALERLGLIVTLLLLYKLPVFSPFWNFVNGLPLFHNGAARITGAILTALAIAFVAWARVHLGRNWSGQPSMKIAHELVTSGPYQFVRHPIYTGMLMALFGSGLVYGPLCMVVFLLATLMFTRRIHVEEAYMTELFPDVYPAYRARTKALIPAVW